MLDDYGKPRVYLGMPFGVQTIQPDVDYSFTDHDYPANPRLVQVTVKEAHRSGSLVDSFNTLWANARQRRDEGVADYFAMQHADIEPDPWWIDTLLSEMRIRNASVIAAHVAIREHKRRITSTAVGSLDDRWRGGRRLSIREIQDLPPTFGPEAVCRDSNDVLYINTGLWLCDLRESWVDDWVFPQECKIERDPESGKWRNYLVTEDWEMSRFLHQHHVRYCCTRRVKTKHWGMDYWSSEPETFGVVAQPIVMNGKVPHLHQVPA